MISAPVCSLMMPAPLSIGSQQVGIGTITLTKVASVPVPVRALAKCGGLRIQPPR